MLHKIQINGSNYTILSKTFLLKSNISVFDLFLNFSLIISTKMYEQYVFKHLMVYVIWICVSQDRFRLLHKWKKFQSVNGTATENHLCFTFKTSFKKGIKLIAYCKSTYMIVISIERACNILSKIVKNITWLPNTSSYILVWIIIF